MAKGLMSFFFNTPILHHSSTPEPNFGQDPTSLFNTYTFSNTTALEYEKYQSPFSIKDQARSLISRASFPLCNARVELAVPISPRL